MPLMGRIADSYGHARIFAAALLLFCAGSAWVALAQGLTMVSIARGVQAIGGGGVVPVSMAIVTANASSSRRVLGLGAIAAASEAGGLFGPLWGGGIAELIGWRGVFWINLPLCLPIALAVLHLGRHHDHLLDPKPRPSGRAPSGLSPRLPHRGSDGRPDRPARHRRNANAVHRRHRALRRLLPARNARPGIPS